MHRLALVAGMASLLDSAAIISVGSALPLWRAELGFGDWRVGLVSFSMTIGIALGALTGGAVADRVGRSRTFSVTVGLYAVGAAVVAVATTYEQLLCGVAVLGLASGADLPASIALVAERTPPAVRGRMVALTHVLWTVGIVLASALALLASPFAVTGTRYVFGALAVGALWTLVARRRLVRRDARVMSAVEVDRPSEAPGSDGYRGRRRILLLIACFYVVYTLVANTFGSFRTYLLVVVGGAGQSTATGIAFGVTIVGLVGTVVFSAIADSRWRRRMYAYAAPVLIGSQALLAITGAASLAVTMLALVAYSLAYPYVGEGLYKVWAQETVSTRLRGTFQGTTIALARTVAALFALVTPALMSWNASALFWLLTAFAVVSSLLGASVVRAQVRSQTTSG